MQKIVIATFLSASILLTACGNKQDNSSLAQKKNELEKLKQQQTQLANSIDKLELEINKLDTANSNNNEVAKLVALTALAPSNFTHYIDLQGKVDADNISYITPRLGGGQVKALYVKRGDVVKKGQLLLKLDDGVIKNSYAGAKQGIESIKTQLAFAKDLYDRQNNLWKQGIGTEVQLLTAKNNAETLDRQLKTQQENLKAIQEQVDATNVVSDVDGIADEVNIKVGELFMGMGQIKIVNTSSLKIITDVPENYSGKVRVGSSLQVIVSELNKTYNTSVAIAGRTINANNRSFTIEAKLPYDGLLRPNQIAQVKIEDYNNKNALTIPLNILGADDKGKYVYVAVKEGNRLIARKKQITVGEFYGQLIEIKSGIVAGELLITEGYQSIYDGQALKNS
jgi:RND family efflux transporter MFP subunit